MDDRTPADLALLGTRLDPVEGAGADAVRRDPASTADKAHATVLGLRERFPQASAARLDRPGLRFWVALGAAGALCFAAPPLAVLTISLAAGLIFLSACALRIAGALLPARWSRRIPLAEADYPPLTVLEHFWLIPAHIRRR